MKVIILDMQYRDGGNWKTPHQHYFENPQNVSVDEIKNFIEKHISFEEPIIPKHYKLSSIAPIDNEFIEADHSDDHCFMEILDVREEEISDADILDPSQSTTVTGWMDHVERLTAEKMKALRKKDLADAIVQAQKTLTDLKHRYKKSYDTDSDYAQ